MLSLIKIRAKFYARHKCYTFFIIQLFVPLLCYAIIYYVLKNKNSTQITNYSDTNSLKQFIYYLFNSSEILKYKNNENTKYINNDIKIELNNNFIKFFPKDLNKSNKNLSFSIQLQ